MLAQLLAFPQLGYVQKKLDVMIYGFDCTYGIPGFPGIANLKIGRTIYVTKQDEPKNNFFYPLGPDDRVLELIKRGNKKAWIFMGGVGIERMWRVIRIQSAKGFVR